MANAEQVLRSWVNKCFPHLMGAALSIYEQKLLLRIFLEKCRAEQPHCLVETEFGGWVPNSVTKEDAERLGLVTQEVWQRNQFRAVKDYAMADLLKRNKDFVSGTLYYFSSVKLLDA